MSPGGIAAEDGDVLINLSSLLLHDAFADPDEVADFLQLQVAVGVEADQVELGVEAVLQQSHLVQVEGVIDGHLLALDGHVEHTAVHPVFLKDAAQGVHVFAVVQGLDAFGVEEADGGEERAAEVSQLGLEVNSRDSKN